MRRKCGDSTEPPHHEKKVIVSLQMNLQKVQSCGYETKSFFKEKSLGTAENILKVTHEESIENVQVFYMIFSSITILECAHLQSTKLLTF